MVEVVFFKESKLVLFSDHIHAHILSREFHAVGLSLFSWFLRMIFPRCIVSQQHIGTSHRELHRHNEYRWLQNHSNVPPTASFYEVVGFTPAHCDHPHSKHFTSGA